MSCSYNASWAQIGQVTSFFLVFFLLGSRFFPNVAETAAAAAAAAAASDTEEYPDYCLKQWTVREKRVLPPLSSEAQALNLRLQQVHALVRHGARAPYDRHCWRWADAADSDLHTSSSRDSSSRDGSSTDGSSFNSSSSSSSTAHRHVGLAPEQDALKSDAERCPPVGHHRQGDCAAAAAAADAAAAAWEVHSDAIGTAAAAAGAREAPHSSGDSTTRDLRAEGSSSSGSSSSSEASSPADAASVAGAAAAAEAPAASTAAATEELGPPWECAIQEELGMNDSRSDQLSTPLLLKKYVASVTEKGLFRGSCVPSSLLDEGQTQLQLVGSILSQAYVVPAAAAHPKQQQQRLLQEQPQQQQQQLVHPLFHTQELCAAPADRVRVRSTDISRTLASGAFLLQSFFSSCGTSPQRVEVETHEVTSDPLLSGYASPVVARLRRQAEASSEFAALAAQQQQAKQQLMEALRLSADELEALWPEVIVDCALTYVCSGRKNLLPPLLQQQNGALLQQLLRFNDQITSFWTSWADAAAAYAAAEPLFHELSTKILAPIHRQQQQQQQQPTLSLYMTHDVTLIAVLAALKVYGGIWPPYASVVVFEVYEYLPEQQQQQQTQQSSSAAKSAASYVFRLAYNGKVLTGKMPGCVGKALVAPDLCSLEVLLRRMQTRPPMPPVEDEHQQRQVQQQQEQQGPRPQKQQQEAPQQQQGPQQPKEQQEAPQQQLNQQQLQQQKEQQEREQQLRLQEQQQLKRQEEM
ncbi:histidine acid phosphatase domain containing protein, putative [Eimeria tenella]|uniref:Histidine acid phosphatase domain containing protein, putative n=1 Tax=Eimeria tenella TaxID=5802 RepID=U6KMU0_EIMTE|nr:histidine acid phosphatase domain containing protein, putative [Eimeria tenella]CDJ37597.1 histidine acid phosphatase domain containing protein, putative [Eimeria tenella]|eukprot:XP_013228435.1 histidine acid phosphatase domain containing protein, putative [Eimeria tenella]